MFQSPQWGKCSKVDKAEVTSSYDKFQSPQWGKCSKEKNFHSNILITACFSPRNGESVLKKYLQLFLYSLCYCFSPRNGESVLKQMFFVNKLVDKSFSPRNGESVLKAKIAEGFSKIEEFQSPQWGKCSKDFPLKPEEKKVVFQSPQWGKCSKEKSKKDIYDIKRFQSPQWGKCSKENLKR